MSFFGIPIRNGLTIGLGSIATLGVNTSVSPPDPGPPWIVLASDDTPYICTSTVLSSDGTSYVVVSTVLSSNGTSYNPI